MGVELSYWDVNTDSLVVLKDVKKVNISRGAVGVHFKGGKEIDTQDAVSRQVKPQVQVLEFIILKDGVDYDDQEINNAGRTGSFQIKDSDFSDVCQKCGGDLWGAYDWCRNDDCEYRDKAQEGW